MRDLKHLDLAEKIVTAMQGEIPALDAYDEDELAALETVVAMTILQAEPKAPDAAEVVDLLREFVRADDDAKVNPVGGLTIGGLADARDNTGCIYQSQQLADALTKARAMIQAAEQEGRA